uniref:Uncharacterized protein n=1 Tax=Quercus lobata TaxID=97700 RepID=A0A7N2MW49_QUELO
MTFIAKNIKTIPFVTTKWALATEKNSSLKRWLPNFEPSQNFTAVEPKSLSPSNSPSILIVDKPLAVDSPFDPSHSIVDTPSDPSHFAINSPSDPSHSTVDSPSDPLHFAVNSPSNPSHSDPSHSPIFGLLPSPSSDPLPSKLRPFAFQSPTLLLPSTDLSSSDSNPSPSKLRPFVFLEFELRPFIDPASKAVPQEPFIPLSKEEKVEIEHAFNTNRRKVLVTLENSNIEITEELLQCLRLGAWLNGEVINVYLKLLKKREKREPLKFYKPIFV